MSLSNDIRGHIKKLEKEGGYTSPTFSKILDGVVEIENRLVVVNHDKGILESRIRELEDREKAVDDVLKHTLDIQGGLWFRDDGDVGIEYIASLGSNCTTIGMGHGDSLLSALVALSAKLKEEVK